MLFLRGVRGKISLGGMRRERQEIRGGELLWPTWGDILRYLRNMYLYVFSYVYRAKRAHKVEKFIREIDRTHRVIPVTRALVDKGTEEKNR